MILLSGAMLITANTRLARVLRHTYDKEQMEKGLVVWTAPDILPLGAWMQRCWQQWLYTTSASNPVQLLSPLQEFAIWNGIVARSEAGSGLIQVGPTADAVLDAWNLMHDWRLTFDSRDWDDSKDTEAFHGWAAEFLRICEKRNSLSGARLPEFITARIAAGEIAVPPNIQLAGFAEFTPAQERLFDAMRRKNANIEIAGASTRSAASSAVRIGFADTHAEIRAAARWSRKLLETAAESGAPSPSIGIVVPELSKYRSEIERLFAEELHPGGRLSPDQDSRRAFNISLGPTLLEYPLVQAAFLILRLDPDAIPFDDLASLLCSPFIAQATSEAALQAKLLTQLRRRREPELSLSDVVSLAPAGLKSALDRWLRDHSKTRYGQPPSNWAATFSTLLKSMGWPGDRPLNSTEYQTTVAWNSMLSEFATLDSATGVVPFSVAVSTMQRLAADRQFQPESETAPIQVLGVLEASGLEFEHLWVIGMHDGAWPRAASPNPFLPLRLQRTGNLPQSSSQRELEFTKQLTDQLLASSPNVVVSFPKKESDANLRSSPLFMSLSEIPEAALKLPDSPGHAKQLLDSSKIETFEADKAPPWSGARFLGGTAIFAQQAACPFQAFAKVRLGAEKWEAATPGLSAMDRGSLVHDVLEGVWREIGTQETLMTEPDSYLNAVVHDEVEASIRKMASKKRALLRPRFAAIEKARLERLVGDWLELEKERQPFRAVRLEERRNVNIGGVDLAIRADRVDKVGDGMYVVIDYKTSPQSVRKWEGARPDEPQLPLYAISSEFPLSGVVFAVARLGESQFAGVTSSDGIIPNVKAKSGDVPFPDRIKAWREVLEHLAADFRNGLAAVDPKNLNQTCRTCGLGGLCRINEVNRFANDVDGNDSADSDVDEESDNA